MIPNCIGQLIIGKSKGATHACSRGASCIACCVHKLHHLSYSLHSIPLWDIFLFAHNKHNECKMVTMCCIFQDVHDSFVGRKVDKVITMAAKEQSMNPSSSAKPISAYIVSNATFEQHVVQKELLARMWNAVPSQFFVLRKDDSLQTRIYRR